MSMSLKQHDYICSSEAKMEKIAHNQDLNLKATELRLGLPGSESPERNTINGGVGGALKNMVSGAKRGFSETVKVPSKTWGFSDNGGSDVKNGGFFSSSSSPRGENKNPSSVKEAVVSSSPKHYLHNKHSQVPASNAQDSVAASKGQVVGWPPIRSFRKNSMAAKHTKNEENPNVDTGSQCVYVKVSMDGAPYLRKVDLKIYSSYLDLSSALEKMFSSFTLGQYGTRGVPTSEGLNESPMDLLNGSEYVLTYEDKDGDLMLVGDVPWDMFTGTCKRMRIMKSSDAIGLAPRAMEKCRGRN